MNYAGTAYSLFLIRKGSIPPPGAPLVTPKFSTWWTAIVPPDRVTLNFIPSRFCRIILFPLEIDSNNYSSLL